MTADKPNGTHKPRHIAPAALVALSLNVLRHRALGFHPKPRKGHCPVGLIVVQGTTVPCTRQTSHFRVARRFAALPTGQTLPSDALDPFFPFYFGRGLRPLASSYGVS